MAIAPRVIATYPTANASGIPVNAVISGVFNIELSPTSVDSWSFLVTEKHTGVSIEGSPYYSNTIKTASFTPDEDLSWHTDYTAIIVGGQAGVLSVNSEPMRSSYAWQFRTGANRLSGSAEIPDASGVSPEPPPSNYLQIVSVYPTDFSTNLSNDLASVNITFNTRPVSGDISRFISIEANPVV